TRASLLNGFLFDAALAPEWGFSDTERRKASPQASTPAAGWRKTTMKNVPLRDQLPARGTSKNDEGRLLHRPTLSALRRIAMQNGSSSRRRHHRLGDSFAHGPISTRCTTAQI